MPILDIYNSEITHHPNFPNDLDVVNIEVGASKNCFEKKYFPFCYLTDLLSIDDLPHFATIQDYDYDNCHFLDYVGNFFELNIERVFNTAIFCNPYGFGFQGKEHSKIFLNKAGEILSEEGELLIIGNATNGWSKYESAQKWLTKLTEENELNYSMQISDLTTLTDEHEYRSNHTFNRKTISVPAMPNQMFRIKKIA